MRNKSTNSILKYLDFIVIDIICLQISFILAHWLRFGVSNPFEAQIYIFEDLAFIVAQLLFMLFSSNYENILNRKTIDEVFKVFIHVMAVVIFTVVIFYFSHQATYISRLHVIYTCMIFFILSLLGRELNRRRQISRYRNNTANKKAVALVTSSLLVEKALENLFSDSEYHDYFICSIFLLDNKSKKMKNKFDCEVYDFRDEPLNIISHEWVDEVLIIQPKDIAAPTEFMEAVYQMGITLNYTTSILYEEYLSEVDVQQMGSYKVYSSNFKQITVGEQLLKRLMDIAGGIVGCMLTAVIFVFIAPMIYAKSPGPIIFSQNRVGKNGRIFKFYKFRSMYMDAEARKAELMKQNKHEDGLMFKVEDDPRIIGSEKKDKNGRPNGIGNFIRRTSLDEFPQFWNVLKGDMSLVGTRPPTLDEWTKYGLNHRIRMAVKPGITGMWQVSGRSEIVNFEEVVRLDKQYIENWSIWLDISILLKTIGAVLRKKGAE